MQLKFVLGVLPVCVCGILSGETQASSQLEVSGLMAATVQHLSSSHSSTNKDETRGAFVFQPEARVKRTERDEFFIKLGFAAGNGIVNFSPFSPAPWAADLEDDVKNINGRNRDYLLTAWYKHSVPAETHQLYLTFGLIDATDYLDENVYSNDEFSQFLNQALVNGPNFFAPSYDPGAAVQWNVNALSLNAVAMAVGENDNGESYQYYGAQIGYTVNTARGQGNYRAALFGTSEDFTGPNGADGKKRQGVLFSFDQQVMANAGVFIRFGWQDDTAAIQNEGIFSGGLDLNGKLWRRTQDHLGIGFAYVDGGNLDIEHARISEVYWRVALSEVTEFTLDLQYIHETLRTGVSQDGFLPGMRLVSSF
jgi:porin